MSPVWGLIVAVLMLIAVLLLKNTYPVIARLRRNLTGNDLYAHKRDAATLRPDDVA